MAVLSSNKQVTNAPRSNHGLAWRSE